VAPQRGKGPRSKRRGGGPGGKAPVLAALRQRCWPWRQSPQILPREQLCTRRRDLRATGGAPSSALTAAPLPRRLSHLVVFSAAMAVLEEAERKILSSLESASAAFRALATADSSRAHAFDGHAESFLADMATAQQLVRSRISLLGPDLPFENGSMRRLVEADIAVQTTAHAHAALRRTLEVATAPATAKATATAAAAAAAAATAVEEIRIGTAAVGGDDSGVRPGQDAAVNDDAVGDGPGTAAMDLDA
jgi:hypothetical protein